MNDHNLNVLVHEKIMGECNHVWKSIGGGYGTCKKCHVSDYMHGQHYLYLLYSSDMNMAWLVVGKLREAGEYVTITPSIKNARGYTVSRSKALNPHGDGTADGLDNTQDSVVVTAPSAAYGICLVAVAEYLPEGALDEYQE